MTEEKKTSEAWEVIYSYTRQEAIADGVLVDASAMAREAGIRYPVALTRGVYESYVVVPPNVSGQDLNGRLWDLVFMLACASRQSTASELRFKLFVRNDNRSPRRVELKAVCGPGDETEPVITVMHPWED